ncbi:type II toxin-antitoxin system HicB family antitoxin [Patescibacteria group bacterium]|nr:type II toxin-antitoxin system HicB family antitoxin [Patescibacteria group bacterium]
MKKSPKSFQVLQYNAVFQQEEDGGYSVWVPALPGCASQGDNFDKALTNVKEAIELYLEDSPEIAEEADEARAKQFLVPITVNYA